MLTVMPVVDAQGAQRELELEAEALAEFLALLGQEQEALKGQQIEEVNALAAEKGRRLETLARQTARRERRLTEGGYTPDGEGMRAWLAKHAGAPGIAHAWARVAALAGEAHEQNEVNGWLVSIQMQRAGRQLAFLNRMASNEPTYSASGVAHAAVRQRSLGEA